jgi:DNA-binding beta-propeller fold protein YncE
MRRLRVGGGRPQGRWFAILLIVAVFLSVSAVPSAFGADSVYWSNRLEGGISFARLDGSGGADVNTTGASLAGPFGTALDPAAGRVYWVNFEASRVSFANLDGTGGGDLNTGAVTANQPIGVAVDPRGGRIYWASPGQNKISFANLDGTGGGDLNTGAATVKEPAGVAVDPAAGRIYWSNGGANKISFAKLDGTGGGDLLTGTATVNGPFGVAVDPAAGRIYWANVNANKISFAKLDGSGGGDLATVGATVSSPEGVALDPAAGRIYWANTGGGIAFAALDGTGGANLSTAGAQTSFPVFPALLKSPGGTGAPVISGGANLGSSLSCSTGSWAADAVSEFLYRAPQSFAYQWSVNGADINGATQSSIVATAPGDYRCRVTAENHAGTASQTSDAHGVSASAPNPPPPLGPPSPAKPDTKLVKATIDAQEGEATFKFRSIGVSTEFQCTLLSKDRRKPRFTHCGSPKAYRHLAPGSFTFEVRAVGPGGADPSPVKKRFKIK